LAIDYHAERKQLNQIDHRAVTIALGVMEEPEDLDFHMTMNRHDAAAVLGTVAEIDKLDHHGGHTIFHMKGTPGTESRKRGSTDHATSGMSITLKTKKPRWGMPALPTGFAERKYPRIQTTP
jgi:hypothetical protein